MSRAFDATEIPLAGLQVIEASAGTGKTFSLALLYLRAVIERGLLPEQILVVTFGVAATAELGERLLRALQDAQRRLCAPGLLGADDGAQAQLLRVAIERAGGVDAARMRVAAALEGYDRRAVFTIHACCSHWLGEFALECAAPPRPRRAVDDTLEREQVCGDYWNARVGADDAEARAWLGAFPSPRILFDALVPLLRAGQAGLMPERPGELLLEVERLRSAAHGTARALWCDPQQRRAALAHLLAPGNRLSRAKDKYSPDRVDRCAGALDEYFARGGDFPELGYMLCQDRIAQGMHPTAQRDAAPVPTHPLFAAIGALCAALERAQRLRRAAWLVEAAAAIGATARRRLNERGAIGYDDLIRAVADALEGGTGAALAQAIARRFPIALLDECQDTDPLQYSIFRRIYRGRDDTALLLVGDPKQAIYRFRGGDVFAYAMALRDAAAARWTLATNYRSEPGLVAAINTLFERQPFVLDFVGFDAACAADPPPVSALQDPDRPGSLHLWDAGTGDDGTRPYSKDLLEAVAVDACADEIVRLLGGSVRIDARALLGSDIAVLVASHRQAELVATALRTRGVATSSNARDSVFGSAAARELFVILQALAEPGDERLLRGALIGPGFDLNAATLAQAADDATVLAPWRERFARLAQDWRRDGVLAAWVPLLADVAAHVLAHQGGERRLVDWRHLAELLAAAEVPTREPEAVLDWLLCRLGREYALDESDVRRPEPGADRVRVMTLHQSKGLQFGVVFAPLLWWTRSEDLAAPVLAFHDDAGAACLDLGSDDRAQHAARAQREHVAEQVRLTYVALTRAVHRAYAVFGKVRDGADAGLARVLLGALGAQRFAALDAAAIRSALSRLAAGCADAGAIVVAPVPVAAQPSILQVVRTPQDLRAAALPRGLPSAARIWSYSALKRLEPAHAVPDPVSERRLATEAGPLDGHGARFGECFHSLLETVSAAEWPSTAASLAVAAALRRHGLDPANAPALERLIGASFDAEVLPGVRLRDVPPATSARELPFLFALDRVEPRAIAACLADVPEYAHLAPWLLRVPERLDGYMRGYLDLAFAHDGRYYVLDYKTDTLGGDDPYAPFALAATVRERGFDLQYLIYAVALRRWLRLRGQVGAPGVVYLFVRGLAQGGGRGVFRAQPAQALLDRLERAFTGGAAA